MFIPILLAAFAISAPPMIVTPDIADGDVITQKKSIKVLVQSDAIVTQVEFYVDDDLRDTATATPYTFTVDPLMEKDGDEKLTFTAYNTDGAKATKSVTVKVDSGASKGAEANTKIAKDFMTDSKWDDAIYAARIALKANSSYVPAQLVLSHVFLAKKVYDKAQEFAEDALRSNPNLPEGLELMATIQLERAFNSYSSGGSRTAFMNSMSDAIESAIAARKKVLDIEFDKLPAQGTGDFVQYGRTAIAARHYSAAISALQPEFNSKFTTILGNLIGYAQLRLGRFDDLQHTLELMKTYKTADGYSYALWAVLSEYKGDEKGADDNMREAILDKVGDLGVQTAQAYIALRRGNIGILQGLAAHLQQDASNRPEVSYYLEILLHRLGRYFDSDREFQDTVLNEPLSFMMYVERGNEAVEKIISKRETGDAFAYDTAVARRMYGAALAAKPDSVEALTAAATLDLMLSKFSQARNEIDAAMAANKGFSAAFYCAASIYISLSYNLHSEADTIKAQATLGVDPETQILIDQRNKAADDMRKLAYDLFATAQKLDTPRLGGGQMPRTADVFPYLYRYGMLPVITPPSG